MGVAQPKLPAGGRMMRRINIGGEFPYVSNSPTTFTMTALYATVSSDLP